MRKITLFLMLFCMCVGAAFAQTLPATDKAFTVVAEGHDSGAKPGWAINNEGTAMVSFGNTTIAYEAQKNFAFVQYDGKVYLYSVWAQKFVQKDMSLSTTLPIDDIKVENVDGGKFYFKYDDSHNMNIGGSKQLAPDGWSTKDGGNQYTLTEVTDFDPAAALAILDNSYTITYELVYNSKVVGTQVTKITKGANYPAINNLPWGATAEVPAGVPTASETVQVTCTIDANVLPFVPADAYDAENINNMKWYYLQFHSDAKNHLYYKTADEVLLADQTTYDENDKDAYSWTFVGNPFDGYTVYNLKAYNANSNLKLNAASTGAVLGTADHKFKPTASSHGTNGFFLASENGADTQRFNKQGGKVVYWSGADAGSTFMVAERPMGPVAEMQALIVDAEALLATVNANIGTVIGEYDQSTADALSAAITTAKEVEEANITSADVENLQAAINAVSVILPTEGKYYQIHSALGFAETKAVYSDGANTRWMSLNNDEKKFYWKAVVIDGKTYLQNAADKKYMKGAAHNSAWTVSENVDAACAMDVKIFTEEENEKGWQYGVVFNGWQMHAQNHGNGGGNNGNIVSWNTDTPNSASAWYIVPVELQEFFTVTYNFNYGGDTKYTQTAEYAMGAEYPAMNIVLPYGVTSDFVKPTGTITADEICDFNLTVGELPFVAAASANDITTWYYARMHTNQPGYIGDIADDKSINVAWGKSSDEYNENFVWGFVGDVFSGITVVNKGTGLQLTSTGGGNATLTETGTPFFVAHTTETSENATYGFCLRKKDSNQYLNANYNAGKLGHWSSTDAGSTMFLTKVNQKEVTVSEADYATLYLGEATYIPAGVEVYTISEVGEGFVMMEAVEGVLPVNTGVILKNAGTYTFQTAAKDAAAIEGNLLRGSVENTYVEGSAYVLANGSAGVGLYKAALNKNEAGEDGTTHFLNNANKAYLPVVANSQALRFNFGETTGIEGVIEGANANATIFDLSGRRVEKMQKGVYIVNGKKVYVK